MPDKITYHLRRQAKRCTACGRPSPTPRCADCLARQRGHNATAYGRHRAAILDRLEDARLDQPHAIAHCGQWHPFVSHARCGICGWELAPAPSRGEGALSA